MPNEMFSRREEYAIGPVEQIPLGEGRTFEVMGLRVAVFRTRSGRGLCQPGGVPA